ncbi:PTS galactitol transporter subunit IIC [Tetragenococcus halophilus subsp. flandriensis]|uniref:PTS galactitol transporter subunit IIC n=1 Tax=Tetragenococcus halophilus TaxID=51669 RepID=UPI0023E9D205|nr:PTS transporter subunit IIC [Tetragenococcus halophilus]GMA07795.1 PTS galactitol transporter subunit IIC [Tetragenococcus halophilus subsp. flandriensis]
MELITQLINDLGNFIFIPLIFLIFMIILGRPIAEAIQSSMKVGIGFISLSMVTDFMLGQLQPAISGLAEKTGSSLNAIDVGGAATAVMGFGSNIGALVIPICVGVNIIMLVLKITDCVNVDVFNLHQNASMGAIVAVYSGNLLYGILTAGLFHVWALIGTDLGMKQNEEFFGLPEGVSISHPVANTYLIFAYPFNWLFDHIPGINKINITAESIQKRFGMFGDPSVIGFILGILLGVAGFDWGEPYSAVISSLQLGMYLGAVMILLPKMTSIMMEGLVPLSNAARTKLVKRFPKRKINVGMDTALIIGDPSVVASALLLIPSLVVLATILPGNKVMPMGDLPMLVFYIACMVPVFKGNIFRTWLSSFVLFGGGLYIASWMTPATNEAFINFGGDATNTGVMYSSLDPSANPFIALFAGASHIGIFGYILIGLLLVSVGYLLQKRKKKLVNL